MSVSTRSMPCLSMMRSPLLETLSLTKRFSLSTQNRWLWIFGKNRRRVLLWAWETLFPEAGRFPVTWQTLDMVSKLLVSLQKRAAFYTSGRAEMQPKTGCQVSGQPVDGGGHQLM